MARKHEYYTDLYTDTLIGFAAHTHLPASIVRTAAGYAIHADAGFGRFLLATNSDRGLVDVRNDLEVWMQRLELAPAFSFRRPRLPATS